MSFSPVYCHAQFSLSCAGIKSGHLIKYEAGTFEPGLPKKKLLFGRPQNSVCASSLPQKLPVGLEEAENDPKIYGIE